MQIFCKTDIGRVRSSNQDAYFVKQLENGVVLAIVCDGMGGANAGNIASELAVKNISDYIIRSYRNGMDSSDIVRMLKNAVTSANIIMYDRSLKSPELSGMGTTAVAAVVTEDFAVISHVGDSRAYLISDKAEQITCDHSVVQSLIESGKLTQEEAKFHPRKNIITRAIGTEGEVTADFSEVTLKKGDSLLLCTDGLTNFVEPQDIYNIFKSADTADPAERLADLANRNGGGDNITVVAVTK